MDETLPDKGANMLKVFQYAAENGAVIAQNSWGYKKDVTEMPDGDVTAINYFIDHAGMDSDGNQTGPMKGGLVIFAAGNDAQDYAFPAKYERVLSVAAIGPDGKAAYYTNYGDWVSVCPPAETNALWKAAFTAPSPARSTATSRVPRWPALTSPVLLPSRFLPAEARDTPAISSLIPL